MNQHLRLFLGFRKIASLKLNVIWNELGERFIK